MNILTDSDDVFSALVNKGNVLYAKNDYEKSREFYKEALTNDSSCVEALYNLGEIYTFSTVYRTNIKFLIDRLLTADLD